MGQKPPLLKLLGTPGQHDEHSLPVQWRLAIKEHISNHDSNVFKVIEGRLGDIDFQEVVADCVVSPANSFGIMDGGYDSVLSSVLQNKDNYWSLTNHCQDHLRERWYGYAPPGTCTVIPLPDTMIPNKLNAHSLAVLPTMRVPDIVSWHKDLVYNLTWSLLVDIERWNIAAQKSGGRNIESVLMTGLGTGTGDISAYRCAQQMVLAVKHFYFDSPLPEHPRWSSQELAKRQKEILKTLEEPDADSKVGQKGSVENLATGIEKL